MQSIFHHEGKGQKRTITFRIDSSIESALERESARLGTSVNNLVNNILRRYVASGNPADQLKLVPVSKDLLRELFGVTDKRVLRQIATRLAEGAGREHILFLFQQLTFNTVMRFLDIWRNFFDGSQHTQEGKTHFYTVRHDVNLNFSMFIKEYVSAMIQSTIPRAVHFETVGSNSVTFHFDEY